MFDVERMSPRTRTALGALIRRTRAWLASVAAIGPDDDVGRRFAAFGAGSCLTFPHGTIFGEDAIAIGRDTLVGRLVALTVGMSPDQPRPAHPVIRIGDRCNIGHGSHIVGHESIEIGDDVTTGPYVYVTDQNHTYEDPTRPITVQWPSTEPVRIGAGSWLGVGCVVLPGTELGRNVVVGANSVVRGRIPDHSVVAGVPATVVRRLTADGWDPPLRVRADPPPPGWEG